MRPKKHLGQHFLTAPAYAKRIADSVPASSDAHVLEIGPGQGALSVFLKERFPDFHLVEIDIEAIERLKMKLGEGSFTVHHADILKFDFSGAGFPLHAVGNLPYSIGAHIIKKTLNLGNNLHSCTFMVQREVAERIASAPHCKTNGFLTIFCSFFGKPKILFHVPPGAFFPRPSVDSSVFQIIIDKDLEKKLPMDKWESFFSFVSKGFSKRRKMVANVLGESPEMRQKIAGVLEEIGLDPKARPEDLGISEWLDLYNRS